MRDKWIDAIGTHVSGNSSCGVFYVCMRHFQETDLLKRGNMKTLAPNAIPIIFNTDTKSQDDCRECERCDALESKVRELENQIQKINLQHDVEIQKVKIGSAKVFHKQKDRSSKKENSQQSAELNKLKNAIEKLRQDRYISNDDARFLNVRFEVSKSLPSFIILLIL